MTRPARGVMHPVLAALCVVIAVPAIIVTLAFGWGLISF